MLALCEGPFLAVRGLLQHGVLKRLRRAQTNHRLGLDLDGLTGLRITAHARLAVRFYLAAAVGDDELAGGALAFFHRAREVLLLIASRGLRLRGTMCRDVRQTLCVVPMLDLPVRVYAF